MNEGTAQYLADALTILSMKLEETTGAILELIDLIREDRAPLFEIPGDYPGEE